MKAFLVTVMLLVATHLFSQSIPKFELTKSGVQSVEVIIDSSNTKEIYQKALKWVNETFEKPKSVITRDQKNKYLRINGFRKNAWLYKSQDKVEIIDMEYSFSIAIKDKKVRLRFSIGQFWSENKKTIYDYTAFFNNTGEIKEDYTDAKQSLENSMNEIASSLYYNIR